MAWYEKKGAGLPAGLQANMDSVLNKKFGTSTTYAPATWPDNVNLMGPLPEKTASGAIASFSDGADAVPCKSVKCSVVPSGGNGTPSTPVPIVGASSITVSQRGKNLLPCGDEDEETINQVNFSTDGEGRFTVSGTATGSAATFYSDLNNSYTIKSGDYLHIMNSAGVATASLALRDANGVIVSRALNPVNRIIDLSEFVGKTVTQISVYLSNGTTYNGTITPMIIHGATSTAFEPYNAIADVTAQIGQTVYGGEYDFNTGVFTNYGSLVYLSGYNWSEDANRAGVFYAQVGNRVAGSDVLGCECFEVKNIGVSTAYDNYISGKNSYGGNTIFFRCTAFAGKTRAEVQAALSGLSACIVSSNPSEITGLDTHTFETALGVNNFYCDTGDTEVTYRADINLALNQ